MRLCYTIQNNKGQHKVIHLADSPSDAQGRFQWSYGYWPGFAPEVKECSCRDLTAKAS